MIDKEIRNILFKIAKKYNMDLTYRYNSKRNIDIFSFTKPKKTIKRLKVEISGDYSHINFSVYEFNVMSNTRKYLHSVCEFDDVKNININDLYEYSDNWECFVDDLIYNLKLNKIKNDKEEYHLCKYCGKLIKRGKVWSKDIFGNGYHHECYLKLQKSFSYLSQSDILGDD